MVVYVIIQFVIAEFCMKREISLNNCLMNQFLNVKKVLKATAFETGVVAGKNENMQIICEKKEGGYKKWLE